MNLLTVEPTQLSCVCETVREQSINQSIDQSINVFQRKIQTVQFTNIYEHILFLHDIHMIIAIMKTFEPFE